MTSSTAPLSTDLDLDTAEAPPATFDDIVININDTDRLSVNIFDLAGLDGYTVKSWDAGFLSPFGGYKDLNGRRFQISSTSGRFFTSTSEAILRGEDSTDTINVRAVDADGNEITGNIIINQFNTSPDTPTFALEKEGDGFKQYTNGDLRVTAIDAYKRDEDGQVSTILAVSNISGRTLTGEETAFVDPIGGAFMVPIGANASMALIDNVGNVIDTDANFRGVGFSDDTLRGSFGANGESKIWITPQEQVSATVGINYDPEYFVYEENVIQPGDGYAIVFTGKLNNNQSFLDIYAPDIDFDALSDQPLDAIYFQANGVPLVGEEGYIAQLLSQNSTGADITLLNEAEASLSLEDTTGGFQYSFVSAVDVEVDETNPNIDVEAVELSDGRKLYTISSAEDATEVPTEITLESPQRLSEENLNAFVQDTVEEAVENPVDFVEAPPSFDYSPANSWQPAARVEINPGGPAAEAQGDELFQNNGRLMGLNNRAGDSTFGDLNNAAFVLAKDGAFEDGSIKEDSYVGTMEFNQADGYRVSADFNDAQMAPLSEETILDGALVDTTDGSVLATFENVIDRTPQPPVVDPITGSGMEAATGTFQQEYFRADTKGDRFGYKGISDSGDQIFVVKDSFDNFTEDLLTGTNYGIMLTEKGTSIEDAFASDNFIMSDSFAVTEGQRTFVAMDGDDVADFMGSSGMDKYQAHLINLDTMEADMSRGVGGLDKDTNANFDGRLDQWGFNNALLATATDVF